MGKRTPTAIHTINQAHTTERARSKVHNSDIIDEWIGWAQEARKLRPLTVFTYRETYVLLLDALGTKSMDKVTLVDLEAFLRRPRGRGVQTPSAATLKREIAELRSLWDWMHARDIVHTNPARMLISPPVHNINPNPIQDGAWRSLWAAELTDEQRVAFGLSFFTGLRRGDVCRLAVTQFRSIPEPMIVGAELKGGKKMDVAWARNLSLFAEKRPDLLPDPQVFVRSLQKLLQRPQGPLLSRWTTTGTVIPAVYGKHMARVCKRIGIDAHPHQLRHAYVSNLMRMGIPLERTSRLAGHSNVQTTMRYIDTGTNPLIGLQEITVGIDMPTASASTVRTVDRWRTGR